MVGCICVGQDFQLRGARCISPVLNFGPCLAIGRLEIVATELAEAVGVPKPGRASRTKVMKCDFCKDKGGEPSHVKACPKKSIWMEEV